MLTIHVRKLRPGTLMLALDASVRVLVGDGYEARQASDLVPGDVIASHGVVTRIEPLTGSARRAA